MGLDNGFLVKRLNGSHIPDDIVCDQCYWNENLFEFGYMRKCWGIRNKLVQAYHMIPDDDYEHILSEDEFQVTLDIIEFFLNEKNFYDEEASTTWSYKDYISVLKANYKSLKWLFDYAREHKEVEIIFYDSY